jgi:hypothetical protein
MRLSHFSQFIISVIVTFPQTNADHNLPPIKTCLQQQQDHGFERWTRDKPMYMTFGGVEGSGHHLFASVFHATFGQRGGKHMNHNFSSFVEEGTHTHNYYTNEVLSHMWPLDKKKTEVGIMSPAVLEDQLKKNVKIYDHLFEGVGSDRKFSSKPVRFVNGGGSHPFGNPRTPYRFVDLITLGQLDWNIPHSLDVRVVFFYRNATDAVLSVLRRGFATEVEIQARVAELDLVYLNNVLLSWPCRKALLLSYEFTLKHPAEAADLISALIDADDELATSLRSNLVGAVGVHNAPDRVAKVLMRKQNRQSSDSSRSYLDEVRRKDEEESEGNEDNDTLVQ